MDTMFFHVEERRAWVRTNTHTVVYDRDQDYPRFERDPTGDIKSMLRIWLAEPGADHPYLCAYLGTFTLCFRGSSYKEILRLYRFTSKAAKSAGQSAKMLRQRLSCLLRDRIHKVYNQEKLRKVSLGYKNTPGNFV